MGLSANSVCSSCGISHFSHLPPSTECHSNSCVPSLSNLVAVSTNGVSDHRPCLPLAGASSVQGHFSRQSWLLAATCFLTSLLMLGQSLLSKRHCTCDCQSDKLLQHHQCGRGDQFLPNKDATGSNNQLNASFTKEKIVSFHLLC